MVADWEMDAPEFSGPCRMCHTWRLSPAPRPGQGEAPVCRRRACPSVQRAPRRASFRAAALFPSRITRHWAAERLHRGCGWCAIDQLRGTDAVAWLQIAERVEC